MPRTDRVLNKLGRPKLLRKEIPNSEALAGGLLLLALLSMGLWLRAQRGAYDPGERDIETALLVEQSVIDDLYRPPLKRWRDPSAEVSAAAPIELGPFSPSLLAGGWRTTSNPQVFSPETLYEKINGQAEQYLKFGFVELTVIELEHPGEGRTLDVYLYDQGTFEGSLGVYQEQRGGKPVLEREGVHYTPHDLGAIGMSGRTFFHATGDTPSESIQALTQRVVEGLAELGQADAPPPGFHTLNRGLGVPFERIAYQPTNAFQYRFAQEFWFAQLPEAEPARLFVHAAESPAAAEQLFGKLHEELLEDYDALEASTGRALLQHKFLGTYFGLMHEGAMVFGVEEHPERAGVVAALERLQQALAGRGTDEDAGGEAGYEDQNEEGH